MYLREQCNLCLNKTGNTLGRTYHIRRENCDVHWRKYFVLKDIQEILIEFLVCGACGNIFQKQLLDDEEISKLESVISTSEWIKAALPKHNTYKKTGEIINSKRFHGVYNFILTNLENGINGKRLLDVGGRNGVFGEPLFRYRIDYTIIDVENYSGHNIPNSKFIHGDFDTYPFSQLFDIIVLNHVLEHVYFPIKTLKRCYELLNTDGILFVDVPILPMSPGTWHRSEFYIKPLLNNAIMRAGFRLINIEDVKIAYDNSIIYSYRVIACKTQKKQDMPVANYREYSLNILSDFHYDIIKYFVETQEPFVIYGVNEVSQRLLQPTPLDKANLLGFTDDDPILWGHEFFGKRIFSPESIRENSEVKNIIILTANKEETRQQLYPLEEKGVHLISNHKGFDTGDNSSMLEALRPLNKLGRKIKSYENRLYNSANNGYIYYRAGQRINNIRAGAVVNQVSLYMDKVGNPTGTGSCVVRKVSDDSIVGTFGTIDISTLPTSPANPTWVLFNTTSIKIPTKGDYRIVFEWDIKEGDSSNYPRVRYNDTDTIGGVFTYYSSEGKWADASNWDTSIKIKVLEKY